MRNLRSKNLIDALQKAGILRFDLSLFVLLASNLVAIVWAQIAGWPLAIILWVYWSQSVGIGILWFFKILTLRDFSTNGFKINGLSVRPTVETRNKTALFFLIHYGVFHAVYCGFLVSKFSTNQVGPILLMAAVFGVYQVLSFFYNRKWQATGKPNIGTMMFFPYARVIPMHITIIAGGATLEFFDSTVAERVTMLIFMSLKTLADLIMHLVECYGFSDRPSTNSQEASQDM